MLLSFDELIERLLEEVALSGSQGTPLHIDTSSTVLAKVARSSQSWSKSKSSVQCDLS